ncbi:helicase-associated domain-containing protein [Staphylospora marina]|uniref:helicase-associated domain-containing protein n=1 Tax=Staphylospora marina TaxID=2490858 RepID=UPI000F5C0545|nr:helicase-associated domain-containing protein [Staphylospora marina]
MTTPDLIDVLQRLPQAHRERLAKRFSSSATDAESLAGLLTDKGRIRTSWERIGEDARTLMLEWIWFSSGWIRERELGRFLRALPGYTEIHGAVKILAEEGWIHVARALGGERVLLVPEQVRRALMSFWLDHMDVFREDQPEEGPAGPRHAGLSQAFFHFVASCALEPLPLTSGGRLSLREAKKLDVEMDLDGDVFSGTRWDSDDVPPWILFLTDIAETAGLLRRCGDRLDVNEARFAEWLNHSWSGMTGWLYRCCRDGWICRFPESAGFWLVLETAEWDGWLSLKDLERNLNKCWNVTVPRAAKCAWEKTAAWLREAGWLWTGSTANDRWVKRTGEPPWTDGPADEPVMFLEPGMELLVPSHFPLRDRLELMKMADFLGGERMLSYAVTASSVARALRCGLEPQELSEMLSAWTGHPLPDWAERKIREWAEADGAVRLEEAVLVRTGDPAAAKRSEDLLVAEGYKVMPLGDGGLAVVGADAETVGECLHRAGLHAERVRHRRFRADEIREKTTGEISAILPDGPATDRRLRQGTLPAVWTAGFRSYPPAMIREMVRKSLELCLDLEVEIRGKTRRLSPENLSRTQGDWLLEAREQGKKVRVRLGEIGRIRIRDEQKTEDLAGDFR